MDTPRKLELAKLHVNMIARADDTDQADMLAALTELEQYITSERSDALARRAAAAAAQVAE